MKTTSLVVIVFIALLLSGCGSKSSVSARNNASRLTEDEKHRLYAAALAASESPLDSDTFKDVCRKIGIFDGDDRPNDQYMVFVSQHVSWGIKPEADEFRREINSREKARQYVNSHLPAR